MRIKFTLLKFLFFCCLLIASTLAKAQQVSVPADKNVPIHHETMGDAYLPNAYNNQRTSPGYKYNNQNTSPAYRYNKPGDGKFMSSSIFTIQVNVNSNGQNILGDAANEPNIAVNPLNENYIAIGWRQFDNVSSNFRQAGWGYSSDAGHHWTFPGVIQPGVFRTDPVLDYDSAGNFYYNSELSSFDCQVFESTNGGGAWGSGTNAAGGDKQWMTIDRTAGVGSGNIYSFWTENYSTCQPGFFTRSTNGNNSYENCIIVDGYPSLGTMAVGNSGELYIAGADDSTTNIVVAKSLNAQVPASLINWNPHVLVDMDGYIHFGPTVNNGGLLGQANIDVDRSYGSSRDNVYVLASVRRLSHYDQGDVMFARSTDGGVSWSSPIRINDDIDPSGINTQWFGTMSVAPNGRIDAVWLDTRDDQSGSDSSALYYSYSINQGNTWSVNEKLSASFNPHVGYPNQNKMGDYFDMVSDNTGAHLAWAGTFNGEEDVYYSRIIPHIPVTVNEISDNATFSIYPNPSHGTFTIKANGIRKSVRLEISNVLGEKICEETVVNLSSKEINLKTCPAGIYFVRIVDGDNQHVQKVVIQ